MGSPRLDWRLVGPCVLLFRHGQSAFSPIRHTASHRGFTTPLLRSPIRSIACPATTALVHPLEAQPLRRTEIEAPPPAMLFRGISLIVRIPVSRDWMSSKGPRLTSDRIVLYICTGALSKVGGEVGWQARFILPKAGPRVLPRRRAGAGATQKAPELWPTTLPASDHFSQPRDTQWMSQPLSMKIWLRT